MKKAQPHVDAADVHVEETQEIAHAEPEFTIDQLRESARALFGISVSTFDGATHGMDGEFTVRAMRDHIEKWLREEY